MVDTYYMMKVMVFCVLVLKLMFITTCNLQESFSE